MIRLRPRIGIFRSLAVLVLLGGLVGGMLISDRKSQQRPASNTLAAEAADLPAEAPGLPNQVTDQKDAQTKADQAATVANAQAKAAEDETRKKNDEASRSTPRGPTTSDIGPIPASCNVYSGNKQRGCALTLQKGFGMDQVPCLVKLWDRESHWNTTAKNPSSGAYGIAQASPGSKMASVGADWKTNPDTQIKWGLGYIKSRYSTPCGAWAHSENTGWY